MYYSKDMLNKSIFFSVFYHGLHNFGSFLCKNNKTFVDNSFFGVSEMHFWDF